MSVEDRLERLEQRVAALENVLRSVLAERAPPPATVQHLRLL